MESTKMSSSFKFKVGDVIKVTETGQAAMIIAQVSLQSVPHYLVHVENVKNEELWEESELESI